MLLGWLWITTANAAQLELINEYQVTGMPKGHLSGLTKCDGNWWAVSDRDDQQLYQLTWQAPSQLLAQAHPLTVPAPERPAIGGWVLQQLASWVQGAQYDFEGISCDQQQNLYLLSEAYSSVLQVQPTGATRWLQLPENFYTQARASGLLNRYNAGLEGIAISADAKQLWLAAERDRRGLIRLDQPQQQWRCLDKCVLQTEQQTVTSPINNQQQLSADFSGLSIWQGRLFTLERAARQICRRNLENAAIERCWSFSTTEQQPSKAYKSAKYGMAEALVIEQHSAWIGLDTANQRRADGVSQPIIWQFAAPAAGWMH